MCVIHRPTLSFYLCGRQYIIYYKYIILLCDVCVIYVNYSNNKLVSIMLTGIHNAEFVLTGVMRQEVDFYTYRMN